MTMAFIAFIGGAIVGVVGTLGLAFAAYYITTKTAIETGEIELDGEWYTLTKEGDKDNG